MEVSEMSIREFAVVVGEVILERELWNAGDAEDAKKEYLADYPDAEIQELWIDDERIPILKKG
jgi:hypothetical protein